MAPGFFSKLVKPPSGSRHSSDREGLSSSGSPSPKSSTSSHRRTLSISSNLNPPVRIIKAPPSPSDASLSSDPSVTVIPPSPRSYTSSVQSDRDSAAAVPGKEEPEKGHETPNRPVSLVNLDNSPVLEMDSGMPTPTPASKNTLGLHLTNNAHSLTPSSSTGNLRDRVRSVVSRSSSRSRTRTNQAEPPATVPPVTPNATSAFATGVQTRHVADPHASSNGGPGLTIVPPAPTTASIIGTGEFQTSPTSANAPTPKTRAFTVPVSNFSESQYLSPDRVRDSDSVSIASTASGRKRRLWRRGSTTTSANNSMPPASPKRKTAGLASALVASVSHSSGNYTASPPSSPPRRKGSLVKRSPALSGHHAAASQSSIDSNVPLLTPLATRIRRDSLSGSSVDDADDDSDDDELLAELNDGDIPVTGFAVASNKRNADFHELFGTVPEGDYLIEGVSTHRV